MYSTTWITLQRIMMSGKKMASKWHTGYTLYDSIYITFLKCKIIEMENKTRVYKGVRDGSGDGMGVALMRDPHGD